MKENCSFLRNMVSVKESLCLGNHMKQMFYRNSSSYTFVYVYSPRQIPRNRNLTEHPDNRF